jgi:hypothetical protein
MVKRIKLLATALLLTVLTTVTITGCAPKEEETSTDNGTSFFPNVNI